MLSDKNLIIPGIKAQADLKLFKENREVREKPHLFNSRKQCRENNRMLSLGKKRDNEVSQFIRNSKKYLITSSE